MAAFSARLYMSRFGSMIAAFSRLEVCGFRAYSKYAPYYIDPIFRREEQEELFQTGEAQKKAYVPVKAARIDETTSVFYDPLVSKLINYIMEDGNKVLARELVERTFMKIKRIQLEAYHKAAPEDKVGVDLQPYVIFHKAVENCKPLLQLTAIKRGGVMYQVPVPVTEKRSLFLAMNWLIEAGQEKDRKVPFTLQFARELIAASKNEGRVVKRKQDLHRQCEANRAYAHYRWS